MEKLRVRKNLYINPQEEKMKTFLIIFIVWLTMFLFSWALVHGAKLQRERMVLFEDDYPDQA